LTASPHVPLALPGVHRVRKVSSSGIAEYWYAWRGGPRILTAKGATERALAHAVAKAFPAAVLAYDTERRPAGDHQFLFGLITRYLAAMAETDLADRTKRDRRKFLDKAREEIGHMELRALESRRARKVLIDWRDGYSATPKTADELLGSVSTVLSWAVDRGEILRNPVKDFPRLYSVNRADIIWQPHQLATLLSFADPDFSFAVRLAAHTAIREGDLIGLPWGAVGEDAIVWQTNKSRGRRTIVVPMTPALRALLAEIPRRATTVLASSRKTPWKAAGLAAGLRRARLAATAHAEKIHGKGAASGIEGLRFHDLRGTAATNFLLAGLEITDVALILGWKPDRVKEVAARYISGQAMGLAMVKRLGQKKRKA
jgi:integrase